MTAALALLVGSSPVRTNSWTQRAVTAIQRFVETDSGNESAFAYAYIAGSIAAIHGWDDPRVATYLEKVYARANPDGGYGLGTPYDAFQDGTINPADTTYTVTITDHVGRVLVEAWQAGVVPRETIEHLVRLVLTTPRITTGPGVCIAYSRHPNDSGFCVHNVNAGAGWFLATARALGITQKGLDEVLDGIAARDAAAFDKRAGWWPYIEGQALLNDFNHNAYNAESELALSPAIGRQAIDVLMSRNDYETWLDPLAQVRLLPYSCSQASSLIGEFDRMLGDERQTPGLLAQLSYWAARTARQCDNALTVPP